ncbi:MAG: stage 0 sporulation protein J [Candidatus Zixiibacteriota bacterium]|nr:MAG: stage 0 sporulation protein J [candidate division Zixibacteria bacterium]
MTKQVLGKGLSALIPSGATTETDKLHYKTLNLDQIAPNPLQPRQTFEQQPLEELAESVKANGVVQPLVVRKNGQGYTIIAGERRYRAARMAGLQQVPTVVWDDVDDVRVLELALVENIHREDLNPLELAEAYRRLIDQCGLTQNELSRRVGRSRAAVANHLRLLTLPDSIKKLIGEGRLTEGHARAILAMESEAQMLEIAERILSNSLSVREVEKTVRRTKRRRLVPKRHAPEIAEMEGFLKRLLGTSVRIAPGLKKGRIEIEYYGNEDLDRIWQLFRKIES